MFLPSGPRRRPGWRDSRHDVTGAVDVGDPEAVGRAVRRIFRAHFAARQHAPVARAFADVGRLFRGEFPGYLACDTPYHDLQHTLDMTLATARLLDGYQKACPPGARLGPRRFAMGIVAALFHDSGYLRSRHDTRHRCGAEYTPVHVSRSARLLRRYLPTIGMGVTAGVASRIVHFTGFERPMARLRLLDDRDRLLGCVLATADLLAQMADRRYLEKCRDRLYPEFEAAGLTRRRNPDGSVTVVYASAEDLLRRTPEFYRVVRERLDTDLDGVHRYATVHFGGRNPYLESMERNVRHLERCLAAGDLALRRRRPPFRPSAP